MKKLTGSFLLLAGLALLSSCGNTGYKRTKSGILYKLITSGHDSLLKPGSVMRLEYKVKLGSTDSVLNSSYDKAPAFITIQQPNPMMGADNYDPSEVFPLLHNNDSAVVIQMVDTLLKKNPMGLPPFLKKGDKIVYTFKVSHVYANDSVAQADKMAAQAKERAKMEEDQQNELAKRKKEAEEDLKTEVPELQKWLADKKINARQTGRGTFVEIKDPGTGLQADSGMYATIRYTGKTLADGKVFQSNMDTIQQAYTFLVGKAGPGGSIAGFDEGVRAFKKGGKGTLYIPGALAYGKYPPQGSPFKPNESLIFDIVVEDVSATPPAPKQAPMPQHMAADSGKVVKKKK